MIALLSQHACYTAGQHLFQLSPVLLFSNSARCDVRVLLVVFLTAQGRHSGGTMVSLPSGVSADILSIQGYKA